ncbi:hypothetical protein K8R33_03630 [archaeon]|nr:hypothetical protein [archaeon]
MSKKANSGSIGGLVFLIAIFIMIYMLIMPPCDKCQLLDPGNCEDVCDEEEIVGVLLFDEAFGADASDEFVHDLNPVNLNIKFDDEVESLAESLFVNRGWFGNVDQDLNFVLEDLDNLERVYFTFRASDTSGKLFIELNEHPIFSEKIEVASGKVINLPLSYLKEKNNLKLYVDSPGLSFWKKNKYTLRDLEIRQEFERVHYEEVRSFSVSETEKSHLSDSRLDFSVFCTSARGLTILKIYLNDVLLSSESIECTSFQRSIDLGNKLNSGENEIKFIIDNGNFLLSPVKVVNRLDDEIYPSYTFEIEESAFDFADEFYLSLQMESGGKEANIFVNNHDIKLDISSSYFEKEITGFVKKGHNFLELVPVNDFIINEIKVWYE